MTKNIVKVMALVLVLVFSLVTLSACGSNSATSNNSTESKDATTGKKLKIVMCIQDPYIDFYVPTRIGALDAGKKLGVDVVWQGPQNSDVSQLLSIVETQIDAGVDGIAICAANPASLMTAVNKAKEKKIPLIVFNNTMSYEGFDGSVGMQPDVAGKAIGQKIEEILSGNNEWSAKMGIAKGSTPAGKVAYLLDIPGSYNVEGRIKGMKEVLAPYKDMKDIGTYDVTTQGMAKAKEVVENILTAHPDVRVIASAAAGSTAAAGLVIKEHNLQDKVLVIGMDLLTETLQLVKDGKIPMAVGQDPYNQGYLPVEQLVDYLKNGTPIPKVTSTKVEFVTKDNVDQVMKREADYLTTGTKLGK